MYVIARHVGETVEIGGGLIKLKVLSITGGIVRLGFDAPTEVAIERQEVVKSRKEKTDARKL